MNTPDTRFQRIIHEFFLPHLIALYVRFDRGPGTKEQADALSCFVIELEDNWFLITAGHILNDLDKLLAHGGRIHESTLFDGWSGRSAQAPAIPFNYADSARFFIDDDDGIDVGVISLPPFLRRSLVASGVQPVRQALWTNPPEFPDRLVVVGLPSELMEGRLSYADRKSLSVEPVIMLLHSCEEPPEMKKRFRRLYGRFDASSPTTPADEMLSDVVGLSGGPVFAFKIYSDNAVKYWVVGIQSSWVRELRVLAFSPLDDFVSALRVALAGERSPEGSSE
jgi:hypothetical protein